MDQEIRLWGAPLLGFTDIHWRSLWARHYGGLTAWYAPFIYAGTSKPRAGILKDLEDGAYPQLLGNNAENVAGWMSFLLDRGFPLVNLNLGCPVKQVMRKGRGAGFLGRPRELQDFLAALPAELIPALSLKIRTGVKDPAELDRILDIFEPYPLKEIILHPRTAAQMYEDFVNLEAWVKTSQRVRVPLIYSGDIWVPSDLEGFQPQGSLPAPTGGYMLGRGLLARPFLAEEIRAGRDFDWVQELPRFWALWEDFVQMVDQTYPRVLTRMNRFKTFWLYPCTLPRGGVPGGTELWEIIKRHTSPREFHASLAQWKVELGV